MNCLATVIGYKKTIILLTEHGFLRDFIEGEDINVLHQPPLTPDCNPIAHPWDELRCAVRNQQNPPLNLRELHQSLMNEQHRIAPERLTRLVVSMPRCLDNIVRNHEGPTGY